MQSVSLLKIEVVTHVLGSLNHCSHCQVFLDGAGIGPEIHQRDLDSYPPEWKAEWQQFSDLIYSLTERYDGQLQILITDARSPRGLWLTLRGKARHYPAFLVGEQVCYGLDEAALCDAIDAQLAALH
ncbi:MAG: hypothetical protein D6755_12225 [Anaerolineae bacterium]|nr:MAG: hypothetical protein D6755_12225 [Anaerolineae bacterium]